MRLLTRYILIEFSKPFFLSLGFFSVIFLLGIIFQDLELLRQYHPSFGLALLYYLFFIPSTLVQVMPLACLFAVLFSLSIFSRGNELIAMRAGGISVLSVVIPLFSAGIFIGSTTLLFNELVVPRAEEMKNQTREVRIKHQSENSVNKVRENLSLVGVDGQLYHIGSFDGGQNTMSDFLMLDFGPDGHIKTRTEAKSAQYNNGVWVFHSGVQREFDANDDEIKTQVFDSMPITLKEKPQDFLKEQKEPRQMTFRDLSAYIRHLRNNGSDVHKEEVYLYYKFASPFGCVILALLGVPWGWTMRKYSGAVLSFFICIVVGLIYIGGMEIGQHLGESGVISPFLSVWIVNFVFAILTPFMLAWKNR